MAIVVHCLILMSANHSFSVVEKNREVAFGVYLVLSMVAAWRFLNHTKDYDIYNFEALYFQSGGLATLKQLRDSNPKRYYKQIMEYFQEKYPSAGFQYKTMKRDKVN